MFHMQFWYTQANNKAASFNLNKVLMTREKEDGTLIVFMDDQHVFPQLVPVPQKNGKIQEELRNLPRVTEHTLNKEDKVRFMNTTGFANSFTKEQMLAMGIVHVD